MDRQTAASLLARLHEAQNAMYGGGDIDPVRALLTPDVRWHVPGENAIAGTYRGLDEVVDYFRRRRELAAGSLRLHPRGLLVGEGQHVASLTDGSVLVEGREHRWGTVGLYRVIDNLIAECWLLPLDQASFDRAWSGGSDPPPRRTPTPGQILIVTGPPGVGKTSVSRVLARRYDRTVHLEADSFFRFIQAGYIPPWTPESHEQNGFVMGLVADTAAAYAQQGYRTVVEGIFAPDWFLRPVLARLALAGHDVKCAVLDAPLSVCRSRLAERDTDISSPAVIERLWGDFRDLGGLDCQVIDTGSTDPAQAAGTIAERW